MDKYRIDHHKLLYHIPRLHDWQQGKLIYPIYIEISPSGLCNHRCTFCALDFMGYQKRFLDTAMLSDRLAEMGRLGVKSIMFGGEGEPFLHKDMGGLTAHAKKSGLDVAFTTNGVLFSRRITDVVLANTEWLKVSINAGIRQTYAAVHRTKEDDFDTVVRNLAFAAERKRQQGYGCTLGMQLLLLPENRHEVEILARTAKDIGMDYLVVKPYSQHPQSRTVHYQDVAYDDLERLRETLQGLQSEEFAVIFRTRAMHKWNLREHGYERCLALPFWSYIDAGGNVWGCSMYLGDERFLYGNIYEQGFEEIWQGEKRRRSLAWVGGELDAGQCRVNCRMDEVNRFLWELKKPPAHHNFI